MRLVPYATLTGDAPGHCRRRQTSSSVFEPYLRPSQPESDVGQLAEVLVVLREAAFTLADRADVLNELDRLNPLYHLEAELILDTQSQRSPVEMIERLGVHLVCQ